jgi:hypothetical protein
MLCEDKGDTSYESGQTGAIKAIPYFSYISNTKGSVRRGKYARRRLINSGYKEKKADRPPPWRGQ